ncbi:hypothetical protein, conserved [Babesia bigemina]|uniref:Uncharacterized protein n=1 Tax=Babesia bigemina TaxID=5866 RepID=A0A061D513_BABBI|nr:hypothetical protein, conserved [Babesia bigemina]CDR94054.1 hypothetical protein, conserved [Babesia bigemina]|eukprot:XP_012766240.1 hypothetical protein, conserved [Babesia bigemina]
MTTSDPHAVFHLLELDLPAGDRGTKRYLYGGVAVKGCVPRLVRLRNIHDYESEVFQASAQVVYGRGGHTHSDSVRIALPMTAAAVTIDNDQINPRWPV